MSQLKETSTIKILEKNKLGHSKYELKQNLIKKIKVNESLLSLAIIEIQEKNINNSKLLLDNLLRNDENNDRGINLRAHIYDVEKEYSKAIEFFEKCINLKSNNFKYYIDRAKVYEKLNQPDLALIDYENSILINKNNITALNKKANILFVKKNYIEAITNFKQILRIDEENLNALYNLSITYEKLNKYYEALYYLNNFYKLNEKDLAVNKKTIDLLIKINEKKQALNFCNILINKNNNKLEFLRIKLKLCQNLNDVAENIDALNELIILEPENASHYYVLANLLKNNKKNNDAVVNYEKAIQLDPKATNAKINCANTYILLKKLDKAVQLYEQLIQEMPNYDYLLGTLVHNKMKLCDWTNYEEQLKKIENSIKEGKKVATGFQLLSAVESGAISKLTSEIIIKDRHTVKNILNPIPKYKIKKKIKVGYFSADLHSHATAFLMAELFEIHTREQFEFIAFSFGPNVQDVMRKRLIASFDEFIEVSNKTDLEIAKLARLMEIDIAIDLKGFTKDSKTNIFSYRAAPIQISYLGYPGTMGADYIDYIIADEILIPKKYQKYYSEKVIYMPDSYQVNDRKREISKKEFTKKELGLPEEGFIYCCLNNNYKITPKIFNIWIEILKEVKGSVLWLLEDNPFAVENLTTFAKQQGLDPSRLIFAKRAVLPEHLARQKLADLFLDTVPCNAHTTASDALWVGLPVLTCTGETFASRVAASLLNAIDLPELITQNLKDYKKLAITLGKNPNLVEKIKNKLNLNIEKSPLFNTSKFRDALENAFKQVYDIYQKDEKPNHIYIKN